MKHLVVMSFLGQLLFGQSQYARQDALMFQAYYFAPLDTLTMSTFWDDTAGRSESMYNGNGSWGLGYADWPNRPYDADHPLVRVVARHAIGLLQLIEQNLADSTTIHRTRLALSWLRVRQTTGGAWPLYTVNQGVVSVYSIYPTALAGRALSLGYRVLDNPRYHIAATAALDWQERRPTTDSPFHQGLELAQRVEHYRAVRHQDDFDKAITLALTILSAQLPNGSWSDPGPLHTDEHAIITEALLMLEEELETGHRNRRRIKAGTTGALNYLLESQRKDGNFFTGVDEAMSTKVPTFELGTLVAARRSRNMLEFDQPIVGAIRAMNSRRSTRGNQWRGSQDGRFLGMSSALIWFVTTQDNLPQPSPRAYMPPVAKPEVAVGDSVSSDTTAVETTAAVPDTLVTVPVDSDSLLMDVEFESDSLFVQDSVAIAPTDAVALPDSTTVEPQPAED